MKIKKRIVIPALGILAILFAVLSINIGTSSMKQLSTENSVSDMNIGAYPEMAPAEEEMKNIDFDDSVEPEKVITNIYLSLETLEFTSTTDNLNQIIEKHNGYTESSDIQQNNRINNKIFKHGQYTIRVPRENVDIFIKEISSVGNVVSQNTSKQDITKQYYDTESRLNVLKIKEERMLALLEKADKIEDIITIENQLSDIIYQKESLTKSILDMDDKVSYSTISISISEVEKLTSEVTSETSFASKIANAITDSLYFFKVSLEKFLITFIYALPYLLIVGVLSILGYRFIKKNRNKDL